MNKNSDNNIFLTIIAIATLLVAILGASFAYFSAVSETEKETITTGQLKISVVSGAVNEVDIIPVIAENITTVTSKISNSNVAKLPITVDTTDTTINGKYDMYLTTSGIAEKVDTVEGNSSHIKWELISVMGEGENITYSTVNSGDFSTGDAKKLEISTDAELFDIAVNGEKQTFNLLIYILDDGNIQDDLQAMTITASISVEARQK